MKTIGPGNAAYQRRASATSRFTIILWMVAGLTFNVRNRHFLSPSSVLLVFPGMFIARVAAVPVLWIDLRRERVLLRMRARSQRGQRRASDWLSLVVTMVWMLITMIWPMWLAVLAARILNRLGL